MCPQVSTWWTAPGHQLGSTAQDKQWSNRSSITTSCSRLTLFSPSQRRPDVFCSLPGTVFCIGDLCTLSPPVNYVVSLLSCTAALEPNSTVEIQELGKPSSSFSLGLPSQSQLLMKTTLRAHKTLPQHGEIQKEIVDRNVLLLRLQCRQVPGTWQSIVTYWELQFKQERGEP